MLEELILAERLLAGLTASCGGAPAVVLIAPPSAAGAAAHGNAASTTFLSFAYSLARGLDFRRRAGVMAGPQRPGTTAPSAPSPVVLLAPNYLTAEGWFTLPPVRAAVDSGLLALGLCGPHGELAVQEFGGRREGQRLSSSEPLLVFRSDVFGGSLPPVEPLVDGSRGLLLTVTVQASNDAGSDLNSSATGGPGGDVGSHWEATLPQSQRRVSLDVAATEPRPGTLPYVSLQVAFEDAVDGLGPEDAGLFGCIVPSAPNNAMGKLVISSSASKHDGVAAAATSAAATRINQGDVKVWTEPAAPGTVSYLMAVVRLSGHDAAVVASVLPTLNSKVLYLRNGTREQRAEVVEVLEEAARRYFPTPPAMAPGMLADIARLFFRLDELAPALALTELCLRVCGEGCAEAHALRGRCLEAAGRGALAAICFQKVLELAQGGGETGAKLVSEATYAIKRLPQAEEVAAVEEEEEEEEEVGVGNSGEGGASSVEASGGSGDGSGSTGAPPKKSGKMWERLVARAKRREEEEMGYHMLEDRVRVSESFMYQLMRNYYEDRGLEAWGNGNERRADIVPFYITSNPRIAFAYARVVYELICDMLPRLDLSEPVYILELGTGPGKFSVLFITALLRYMATGGTGGTATGADGAVRAMSEVSVVYVMTDFTLANVDAWGSDKDLSALVEQGVLDYGVMDLDHTIRGDAGMGSGVKLVNRGTCISPQSPAVNPLVAISNYVFDSLRMDAFRVERREEEGGVREGGDRGSGCGSEAGATSLGCGLEQALVSTFTNEKVEVGPSAGKAKGGADAAAERTVGFDPTILGSVRRLWSFEPIQDVRNYYRGVTSGSANDQAQDVEAALFEQALGTVLAEYAEELGGGSTFTFPLGGLYVIKLLQSLTMSGAVAMLIADKGHNRTAMLNREAEPIISLHGSLSMMVNMDSVHRFVDELSRLQGGSGSTVLHTPMQTSTLDACFVGLGFDRYLKSEAAANPTTSGLGSRPELRLGRTTHAFVDLLCLFSVSDHFNLRDHVEDSLATSHGLNTAGGAPEISVILSLIRLSRWDPDLLWQLFDRLEVCLRGEQALDAGAGGGDLALARRAEAARAHLATQRGRFVHAHTPRFDFDGTLQGVYDALEAALDGRSPPLGAASEFAAAETGAGTAADHPPPPPTSPSALVPPALGSGGVCVEECD